MYVIEHKIYDEIHESIYLQQAQIVYSHLEVRVGKNGKNLFLWRPMYTLLIFRPDSIGA